MRCTTASSVVCAMLRRFSGTFFVIFDVCGDPLKLVGYTVDFNKFKTTDFGIHFLAAKSSSFINL